MVYNYHFECAASFILLLIWLLFISRSYVVSKSSRYFSLYCIFAFLSAIADIYKAVLFSSVSPDNVLSCYITNGAYMSFYVFSGLIFVLYADSVARIGKIEKPLRNIVIATFIYQVLITVTTPFTHLYFYFDENLNYLRGPLYYGNFIIGIGTIVASVILLSYGRSHFSRYQSAVIKVFLAILVVSNIYQYSKPHVLVGGITLSVLALFLFVAFENPANYYYKNTHCLNLDAFNVTMKSHIKNGEKFSIVFGICENFEVIMKSLNGTQRTNMFKVIADRIASNFGKNAFLLDGDHFAICILGEDPDLVKEKEVEDKVKKIFEEKLDLAGRLLPLVVNTAIIPSKYTFSTIDDLNGVIEYLIKLSNNIGLSDTEKIEMAIEKKHRHDEIEKCVEKAIKNDGFKVYYQPIFNVETEKFESAEALVRLIDDELGFVSPEEFIPITEECGQIIPLGEIIFKKVCQFTNVIKEKNLGVKYIEVNMSPVQCEKRDIVDTMFSIMDEYHTEPDMINFEITETAEAEFSTGSLVVQNIVDMNKRGVNFSIDDFGSGFAAMDHLFSVPVDLVKVDKSILWQAIDNKDAMIVLRSTLQMIHSLGKKILVEGVESQEMVDILKEIGCNYMQGYFFSKPIPEDEYLLFLKEKNQVA